MSKPFKTRALNVLRDLGLVLEPAPEVEAREAAARSQSGEIAGLSSETLAVLLDTAWRKDEAMVGSYDQQTTRAGAVIGGSVAVTALFGQLFVTDDWVRFAFLVPLAAQALACYFAVKAWRVKTLNRAPRRDVLVAFRAAEVTDLQDKLISTLRENLRFNGPIVQKKVSYVKTAFAWAVVGTAFYAVLLVIHIFDFPKPHA